ncbi:hypothetical protein SLS58_002910 [Diplodia intermedia]|uniref:EF-hand domain-containing protein n=1 Tax=Diplodia intermedia TaxID=856260 RepID=A0ABR3TXZ6_9PEZI
MEILEELLDQSWLARLRGYDRNGDGAATLDEVREKNFRDPRIPDGDSHIVWFRKWDKDKNGVVNRQEGPKRQEE